MITAGRLLTDRQLLGPYFAGASWLAWKSVLKAVYAERLGKLERDLFVAVAGGREPPRAPVKQVVAIVGRRGGKDSAASAIATKAAVADYGAVLRPGERATVLCLACDRAQARIVLGYIKGYFAKVPLLRAMIANETADGLELQGGNEVIVGTNDFRSVRGRTVVCAILDEAAFYASEGAASSDREIVAAITPALTTVGGQLIIISSPWRKSGVVYERFRDYFGKPDEHFLVIRGATRVFNPTIAQSLVDEELERDPQTARAEWLAEFRDDISGFVDPDLVQRAVERGRTVLPPREGVIYHAFADPSGGAGDSFTLAIAHADGDAVILDCLLERRAPFNPASVTEEMTASLKPYGVHTCIGDKYAAQWVVEAFARHGVTYRHSERDRSALYLDALPLFTSGRVQLLDNARLVAQFAGLERRTAASGRDRIDHGPHGHDDLCNAVAGALVLAAQRPLEAVIAAPILIAHPSARNPATISAFEPAAAFDFEPRVRPEDWSPRW
ncbi:MAG TPA: hypothetical protein VGR52_01515 [Stellaceae bacterium]|nr:hypothetical protein [Stellaceae bacterium]